MPAKSEAQKDADMKRVIDRLLKKGIIERPQHADEYSSALRRNKAR